MPKNKDHGLRKGLSAHMPITVRCEWGSCQEEFTTMEKYTSHVTLHLENVLLTSNIQRPEPGEENNENFQCAWQGCLQDMGRGFIDLVRHVYFHAFHSKLKSYGRTIIDVNELGECRLEASSRNMIPELPDRLQCVWTGCNVISDNPDFFYQHVTSHIHIYQDGNFPKELASCLWEGCEMKTKSKYKLREHLRSHTQEKVIACPTCGGLFANTTKMFDHLQRQIQPTVQTYQCSHCNKRCPTERLLRDHMRHHVNHYKCPFCDMTCPNPSGLRAHIKYRHSEEKPFVCSECDYGGKSIADLRRHSVIHANEPSAFSCNVEDCVYTGNSYFALTVHFRKEHQGVASPNYQCHLCSQTFTRGTSLTKHLKKGHKFKWPSGHKRFRYKLNDDGVYRLQTVRYESIELTQQLLSDKIGDSESPPAEGQPEDEEAVVTPDGGPMRTSTPEPCRPSPAAAVSPTPAQLDLCYNLEMLGEVAMKLPKGLFCRQIEQQKRKRDDAASEDGTSAVGGDGASGAGGDASDQSDAGEFSDAYEESICGKSSVQYSGSECGRSEYEQSEFGSQSEYQSSKLCYVASESYAESSQLAPLDSEAITARLASTYDSEVHLNAPNPQPVLNAPLMRFDVPYAEYPLDLRAPHQDMPPMFGPVAQSVEGVNCAFSPRKLRRIGVDGVLSPDASQHIDQLQILPRSIEATTHLFGGVHS